jgi:hypothetical protein
VFGIEVVVGEMVSHSGDRTPRLRGFSSQQVVGDRFDGFADLDEANADCIEDQPIGQITATAVAADRGDRIDDVR